MEKQYNLREFGNDSWWCLDTYTMEKLFEINPLLRHDFEMLLQKYGFFVEEIEF
ncbi:MAG: hypothetical protein Q8M92_01260 [Candidatus Subteraquimicrobiales bacterium]|nr:hypothetical protein [Candidatus Subteraquimicrobiales bacterium]